MSIFQGKNRLAGFTLVETMISLILISGLFGITFKVFSYINSQRAQGSVDLQELQGARYAINYLRRDFRCAVPHLAKTATLVQKKQAARMPVVETKSFVKSDGTVPILISSSEIHFFRQVYNTPDLTSTPATEEINYHIDDARKCLVRSIAGKEKIFPAIKGARFELYGHPLKSDIPMLLVTLVIDADTKQSGAGPNFLELTTTISSSVANQNINNPYWHDSLD
ncbi:MAG: hypothetical protein WA705_29410 [Candidatus Ozemobacteraceae bacterium]